MSRIINPINFGGNPCALGPHLGSGSLKKTGNVPGEAESEGAFRDEVTGGGSCNAGRVYEKAAYSGDPSGVPNMDSGDMSIPDLERSDGLDCTTPCWKLPMTPMSWQVFGRSVRNGLGLPTVDPGASFDIPDAQTATSPTTWYDLQADSSLSSLRQGADIPGKDCNTSSHLWDEKLAYNPYDDCFEEHGVSQSSTPYLVHDHLAPQTAAPGTLSPSLVSPLSSAHPLNCRASAPVSPMSNVGPLISPTQQVQGIGAVANVEENIDARRSYRSTLPSLIPKQKDLQGRHAKLRVNTLTASDPAGYHWYPSWEREQIPVQIEKLGLDANHGRGPHLGGSPPQIRIRLEELRGGVRIVNDKWLRMLVPNPRCSTLFAHTLFAEGICTLKTLFFGKIERTFKEIFAFVHIALAAAFILYHDDESYCWKAFFDDARQLQYALNGQEEKMLFLTAMECWGGLPGQQVPFHSGSPRSSVMRNAKQVLSMGNDQAAFLQSLRNGEVFAVCSGFLDGFEEAKIFEDNMSLPGGAMAAQEDHHRIGDLIDKIIRPLEQRKADGDIRCIREVEAMLLSTNRRTLQSHEVFERLPDCVTSQCNTAMGASERLQQNDDYLADPTDIMNVLGDSDWDQGFDYASRQWSDTSVSAVMHPSGISLESPTLQSSASAGAYTIGSSPTSLRTQTSMGTSQEDDVNTQTTSPMAASQTSNSPTSLAFDCHLCRKSFSGSDARSNLNRHLRSPKVKCPQPDCEVKSMRSDNLGSHLKRIHGLTSPDELEQAKKKSKGLGVVLESACAAR